LDRLIKLHKLLRSDEAVFVDVFETDVGAGRPGARSSGVHLTREPYFLTPPLLAFPPSRPSPS